MTSRRRRAVGRLSRPGLTTRPGEAGPSLRTPGAQCLGESHSRITLHPADDATAAEDAECALRHDNAFQLLVATILSAQCTDVRVNIVTQELFAKYPTVDGTRQAMTLMIQKVSCLIEICVPNDFTDFRYIS